MIDHFAEFVLFSLYSCTCILCCEFVISTQVKPHNSSVCYGSLSLPMIYSYNYIAFVESNKVKIDSRNKLMLYHLKSGYYYECKLE